MFRTATISSVENPQFANTPGNDPKGIELTLLIFVLQEVIRIQFYSFYFFQISRINTNQEFAIGQHPVSKTMLEFYF